MAGAARNAAGVTAMNEPWFVGRWQDASDPPEYAEHNARIRYEAAREEIYQTLIAAIHSAGDAFAGLGMSADDAGGWIDSAFEVADWAWYFEAENSQGVGERPVHDFGNRGLTLSPADRDPRSLRKSLNEEPT
jgi:hypothetical protein